MKPGRLLPVVLESGEVVRIVNEDTARELLRHRTAVLQWGKRDIIGLLLIETHAEYEGVGERWPGADIQQWMTLGDTRWLSPFQSDPPMRPSVFRTESISELEAIRMQSRKRRSALKSSRLPVAA